MAKPWIQTALTLAGALMVSSHHYAYAALDDKKWCRVENNTTVDYYIVNSDATSYTTWGTLWIREKGSPPPPKPTIVKSGDPFTLGAGKKYEFYFDTRLKKFAMHLKFKPKDPPKAFPYPDSYEIHVTNLLPPITIKGFVIIISSEPMRSCNLVVDPTGFRNIDGGVLFNIAVPNAAPTSSADPNDDDTDTD
jgi:hypothetical protein